MEAPLAHLLSLRSPLTLFLGFWSLDLQAHPYVSSYIQCGVNKLFVPPRKQKIKLTSLVLLPCYSSWPLSILFYYYY